MGAPARVVDEAALPKFRADILSPAAIHSRLPDDNGVLLVGGPPGVGKTYAAHGLLKHALSNGHDLIVYIAPTRALIGELLEGPALHGLGDGLVVLERRPSDRCGALDGDWRELESSGCAALAKSTLCASCPRAGTCPWPDQFDRIDETTKVVIFTEAYLELNPALIQRVVKATGAIRPLVILDEASFMTTSLVRSVALDDIRNFAEAVTLAQSRLGKDGDHLSGVSTALTHLIDGQEDLTSWPLISRFDFLGVTTAIQKAGRDRFGARFRYVGNDLVQLTSGARAARWYDDDAYSYVPVPDTRGCDVAIFAPYLPVPIIEERLQRPVTLLFDGVVFRHSKTRVINIADSVGALRTITAEAHFARVADVVVALLLRDRLLGRKPVVVTKKALIRRLQTHIETRSSALGQRLVCLGPDRLRDGADPAGADVVLVNYGILGVNSLKDHDALYCFGGYYARQSQLSETYNQTLPPDDRIDLVICSEAGRRRVLPAEPDPRSRYHARRAQAVLEMIERRIVLQAIGRVRPFTSPATVVAFQMDDLSGAFGEVETFGRVSQARAALNIPSFKSLARATLGDRLRPDQGDGLSYRDIAARHGLPLSTIYKALKSPTVEDRLRGIAL